MVDQAPWFKNNWDVRELNEIVRRIEITIRTKNGKWNNRRFQAISASYIRDVILQNKIGKIVCEKCLNLRVKVDYGPDFYYLKKRARYCSKEHREYYQPILSSFYFKPEPWDKGDGDSIDHIKPIASGGLEFDRDNLQWMPLSENIKKSGGKRYEERIKQKVLGVKTMSNKA